MATPALTLQEHEEFVRITANAFDASTGFDEHNSCHCSIRAHLVTRRDEPVDEAIVAECEASGHVWTYVWHASSVGFYVWHAGTYAALVRRVLADATLEMQHPWDSATMSRRIL